MSSKQREDDHEELHFALDEQHIDHPEDEDGKEEEEEESGEQHELRGRRQLIDSDEGSEEEDEFHECHSRSNSRHRDIEQVSSSSPSASASSSAPALPSPCSEGCTHYRRRCVLQAPCCKKFYTCRFCHNDAESHEMDRYAVEIVKCVMCNTIQPIRQNCSQCGVSFGAYFCSKCKLLDDDLSKKVYHCDPCGLCRVGPRENYFHCETCQACMSMTTKGKHKCVEQSLQRGCPVCLIHMHTSTSSCQILPCGHSLHSECYKAMCESGMFTCPICHKAVFEDLSSYYAQLDEEIARTPMPEEYRDFKVKILCNECLQKTECVWHVLGAKCSACGSYNTSRI